MRIGRYSRGSLTLEAAFTLSFFLLAMISWILLFIPYQVQSMTQHALDQSCLALADKISLTHTLTGKEGGLSRFAKALTKKKISLPIPEMLREMGGNLALDIGGEQALHNYFGRGTGFLPAMQQVEYDVHLDDDRDLLCANLTYLLDLPGLLKPLGPLNIHQSSTSGVWLLTDDPVFGRNDHDEEDSNKKESDSVWKKPPFTRGRILVDRYRKKSTAIKLQKGQIADLFYADGTAEAIVSLNLFSSTYSKGSGTEAENYHVQKEAVYHALVKQAKRLRRAMDEHRTWKQEDGSSLDKSPSALRLRVIVPEEANHFAALLTELSSRLSSEDGVSVSYAYEEKALFAE